MPEGEENGPRAEAFRFLDSQIRGLFPAWASQPPAPLDDPRALMEGAKLSGASGLLLSFEPDADEYYDRCRPTADAILLQGRREILLETGVTDEELCSDFARCADGEAGDSWQRPPEGSSVLLPEAGDTGLPRSGEEEPQRTWMDELERGLRSADPAGSAELAGAVGAGDLADLAELSESAGAAEAAGGR